jgi:hypothetical protein
LLSLLIAQSLHLIELVYVSRPTDVDEIHEATPLIIKGPWEEIICR